MLRWYGNEPDSGLKELILEHLALSDEVDDELQNLLGDCYKRAEVDGSLRRRLRAAVAGRGGPLYQMFKRIDVDSIGLFGGHPLFSEVNLGNGGVTVNNNTFNVGRDIVAQNVAGGNASAVASRSNQIFGPSNGEIASILERVISLSRERDLAGDECAGKLVAAAEDVSRAPTHAAKRNLLDVLKSASKIVAIGSAAAADVGSLASTAEKIKGLIDAVSSWN